jgi:hypothetical protein
MVVPTRIPPQVRGVNHARGQVLSLSLMLFLGNGHTAQVFRRVLNLLYMAPRHNFKGTLNETALMDLQAGLQCRAEYPQYPVVQ